MGAKASPVIRLNGKQYDAQTGHTLGAPASYSMRVKPLAVKSHPSATRSIDGMIMSRSSTAPHSRTVAAHGAEAPTYAPSARSPHPVTAHKPQRSKTLMRHAVKTPATKLKPVQKLVTPLDAKSVALSTANIKPKLASDAVDRERARRAKAVHHSPLVQHFTPLSPLQPHTPALALTATPSSRNTSNAHRSDSGFHHTPVPPLHTIASSASLPSKQPSIFDTALARATSHQEPAPRETRLRAAQRHSRRHKKLAGISASVVVFLALVGFVGYLNRLTIQVQLASAKAGFHVIQPQYKPDGYSLGTLTHNAGTVAFDYHNTQNQSFSVVQKKSNWDSQTLLDNYVSTSDQSYQGYSANGRTVYVYGDGNATWVNAGIWYQIHANKTLPSDQLVKVAASM